MALKFVSFVMQDWPMKSKLDPKIYGLPETLITTELVERGIRGIMTVNEVTYVLIIRCQSPYVPFLLMLILHSKCAYEFASLCTVTIATYLNSCFQHLHLI